MHICYVNLSSGRFDDDGLNLCLNQAPTNSIILLEDIDGIFVQRESVLKKDFGDNSEEKTSYITFSGLLNALDGVRAQEGRIIVMTTNHREKLDAALMRPGRCDLQVELYNASAMQMYKMFKKFFPDCSDKEA